eukprot:CAMPEP_0117565078 /NCGR_PEP_ID=MMETSP0784-20121206/56378_1 /TAXON_ID=39447 /ORGANISM="" /LENGTH=297 /DNA_ID=CAMNT_0005362851 /DNA_START=102 /DNA_END=995 /DNA_ORIENTATION=+
MLVAAHDVQAGEPLLVEAPLLSCQGCGPGHPDYAARMRILDADLTGGTPAEKQTMVFLALLKLPMLAAFARAPRCTQERVLALQNEFADPGSDVARAVGKLSCQLKSCLLVKPVSRDLLGAAAVGSDLPEDVISSVATCALVNSFDFMPAQSDALFYTGSLFQHSCSPNAKYHTVLAPGPKRPGVSSQGMLEQSWVGEWRALRRVRAGEAVCISYLDDNWLARNRQTRRDRLLRGHGFHCCCACCEQEVIAASKSTIPSSDLPQSCISWGDLTLERLLAAVTLAKCERVHTIPSYDQ